MTLRAPPSLVAAAISAAAAEKMSLNKMNSAHDFVTFFCTCFYLKASHALSFQLCFSAVQLS